MCWIGIVGCAMVGTENCLEMEHKSDERKDM
jgi:hypothetical protein